MKFTTIPTTIDYQMLSLSKTNHAHIINVAKINEPPFSMLGTHASKFHMNNL